MSQLSLTFFAYHPSLLSILMNICFAAVMALLCRAVGVYVCCDIIVVINVRSLPPSRYRQREEHQGSRLGRTEVLHCLHRSQAL